MARPRMRPRFVIDVEAGEEAVMSSLRDRLESGAAPFIGVVAPRHCVVRIPPERRNFWSPQLDVLVEETAQDAGRSRVVVRFSPHPPVFLAFVFTYGVLFALGLSGMMYAMAELSMGRTPYCLLSIPAAIGAAAFVYGAAFIGQGLGSNDMFELRTWLEECLDEARARARRTPVGPRDSAQL